ncbi:MAG: hypothetical protein KGQ37_02100 [Hyphomicrobiales bacterium]|nr:hypothetical protein [Hyphomicrobiales bacterium]
MVFDAGDFAATRARNRIVFKGKPEEWPRFVDTMLRRFKIDGVITFNDAHYREAGALAAARRLGIKSYVLEHGYLRPHWITFERDGVNAHSRLPRDIEYYRNQNAVAHDSEVFPFKLRGVVLNTIGHYALAIAGAPFLRYDSRYYGDPVGQQAWGYASEIVRRLARPGSGEAAALAALKNGPGKIHLCLLQKPGDVQLLKHSRFGGNLAYLGAVLQSFATSAPAEDRLIVKQHPLDYGKENSESFVQRLGSELGISERITFIRNISIEAVMPLIASAVTINSTAGLACLMANKAVKCMGDAIYDFEGLTFQEPLDAFWTKGAPAAAADVACFVNYLKSTSQFCGGFETASARNVLIPALVEAIMKDSLVRYAAPVTAPAPAPKFIAAKDAGIAASVLKP